LAAAEAELSRLRADLAAARAKIAALDVSAQLAKMRAAGVTAAGPSPVAPHLRAIASALNELAAKLGPESTS
jgi:hypothetical protein